MNLLRAMRSAAAMLADNPVLQREMLVFCRSRKQRITILLTILALCFTFVMGIIKNDERMVYLLLGLYAVVSILGAIFAGAASLAQERERQRWHDLVMTRLEAHEIVLGKVGAAFFAAMVPTLLSGSLAVLLAVLVTLRNSSGTLSLFRFNLGVAYIPFLTLLIAALAVAMSAQSRRASEATSSLIVLVILTAWIWVSAVWGLVSPNGPDAYFLYAIFLFLCTASATIAIVASVAASLPGYSRDYTAFCRVSGGIAILSLMIVYGGVIQRSVDITWLATHVVILSIASSLRTRNVIMFTFARV